VPDVEPVSPAPSDEKNVQAENEPERPSQEDKNSVASTPVPNFPNFEFVKNSEKKRRGRQRAKDAASAEKGVKQLFELWWDEGQGQSFTEFFKDDLSDDMCALGWGYYPKHFIAVKGRSHAEYVRWRREWRQNFKFGGKFGSTDAEDASDAGGSKIIQLGGM